MKKAPITFLVTGLLLASGVKAQTIQEGVNHLNSGRVKTAISVFEKMRAINPNNAEATYWLGQSYLDLDEIAGARIKSTRELYEKALQSTTTTPSPILLVGMGHVELLENKTSEARQRFETALTMTRTKKGDDQNILIAVGRANVDAKSGDYKYAIEKLLAATDKGEKSAEAFLQLGNAYRKAGQGSGGGDAFESYKKALSINPAYSIANLRLAKLFESQKNWELVLQYLNESVSKDPKFTAGYRELFEYYFYRAKFADAEIQLKEFIKSKLPETEIQDEYLYAQLCWGKKDFDCAITKAEKVVLALGVLTKPKVYRLLTDAFYQKGIEENLKSDTINALKSFAFAKKYSDEFHAKKNPDDIILYDYQIRADILDKTGGTTDEIFNTYVQGAALDTLAALKVDLLKKGIAYFKENKLRNKEALLIQKMIELKPKPTINDYFDLTLAYYFGGENTKSRDQAIKMIEKYPDQVYGYEWALNNARLIDTAKKDSIAVPDALKLFDFSSKDTAKFKKQFISAASYLAIYYANDAKDKEKAIDFLKKWQMVDVVNAENIQKNIDLLMKSPTIKPPSVAPRGNAPPAKSTTTKTATKKSKLKTTVSTKTVAVKK